VTDVFSVRKRSVIMSHVRSKHTKPEIVVRSVLHGMGYRFGLHRQDLPGCPDIALTRHAKAVFVNGCFWHGHKGCRRATRPGTHVEFWQRKLEENAKRDRRNVRRLHQLGWKTLVVWQCQTTNERALRERLRRFMCPRGRKPRSVASP
jgi:DNA mismatch endonuclease, patch repair protein